MHLIHKAGLGLALLTVGGLADTLPADAQIFVADQNNSTIQEFTANGASLGTFASSTTGLNNPNGIAINSVGDLYVTNESGGSAGLGSIQEYSSTGSLLNTFGDLTLNDPEGIAFDSSGNLFVTNESSTSALGTGTIQEYSASGTLLNTFGTNTSSTDALTFGPNGNLYVVDESNGPNASGTVQEYSTAGTLLNTFGSDANSGSGLNNPEGIAADKSGNVYITDTGGFVYKYSASGVSEGTFGSGFGNPYGITLDNKENVYVADQANGNVTEFSSTGVLLNTFGTGNLGLPTGIAVEPGQLFNPVPEASSVVSLGLLLMLGLGAVVVGTRRRSVQSAA